MSRQLSVIAPGTRFGKLVVIRAADPVQYDSQRRAASVCQCDCGSEKIITNNHLKTKIGSRSCGCEHYTHGLAHTAEYIAWTSMQQRCYNKKNKRYQHYGGRGIEVCERWRDSFEAFLSDMGPRPAGHSIDRIDNDKSYTPANCKWSTQKQQQRNRQNNVLATINGETRLLVEWCERLNVVSYATAKTRLRRGWSDWNAVMKPARPKRPALSANA